jgi:hypothetical protein
LFDTGVATGFGAVPEWQPLQAAVYDWPGYADAVVAKLKVRATTAMSATEIKNRFLVMVSPP